MIASHFDSECSTLRDNAKKMAARVFQDAGSSAKVCFTPSSSVVKGLV
jgi:hypothetical protein